MYNCTFVEYAIQSQHAVYNSLIGVKFIMGGFEILQKFVEHEDCKNFYYGPCRSSFQSIYRSLIVYYKQVCNDSKSLLCIYLQLKHYNCMNSPVRHKKLIKNQIRLSKLAYDNTFTNKAQKKMKNFKFRCSRMICLDDFYYL